MYRNEYYEDAFAGGVFLSIVGALGFVVYCIFGLEWVSSGVKAEVVNREFNTNYTQKEIFFAESVIEEIRQIQRNRHEINGNLIHNEK